MNQKGKTNEGLGCQGSKEKAGVAGGRHGRGNTGMGKTWQPTLYTESESLD